MSYDVQTVQAISILEDRTFVPFQVSNPVLQGHPSNLPAGFYVQGGSPGLPTPPTSNVKIKRPDGTWATVLKVTEVHLRRADGTWEIFS